MKKILCFAVILSAVFVISGTLYASALEKQPFYQYDERGVSRAAPEAYTVERVWHAQESAISALSEAQDIFVSLNGTLYIADTGNNRILVLDAGWKLIAEINTVRFEGKEQPLSNPKGVFASADGLLYVCDTGNNRVIAIDAHGDVQRQILGENIVSVQEMYDFKPERAAVDSMGNVYVVSSSVYQGIMRFSADDEFSAFFAPNEVRQTLSSRFLALWKSFFTDAQKDSMEKLLSEPYNNLFVDADDFIYTTAQADAGRELKKNNLTGANILRSAHNLSGSRFGDVEFFVESGAIAETALIDVHADSNGFISVIDKNTNRVYQYTQECDLIAIFGGSGDQKGQFAQMSALEKRGDSYLVLDSQNGSVTVYSPTPYIQKVHEAILLYNQGLYVQAESLWSKVLAENSNMILAYKGIGRAALQESDFKRAMQYLDKGADEYFYSIAVKEYRKAFIRRNAVPLLLGSAVTVSVFVLLFKKIRRYLLSGNKRG